MAVLLTVTSVPMLVSGGTYNAAATAFNTGVWRLIITPSQASTAYTGGNFHSIMAQVHGGLWLDDKNLELYTTPDDALCFSIPLTWTANQPITIKIDARSGTRSVTISGAATGNGTYSYSTAGPYFDPTQDLELGRQGGGTNFEFLGNISNIDDATTGFTANGGTFALTGGPAVFRRALKLVAAGRSLALTGGNASFVTGKILTASGGTFALTGGPAVFRRALKFVGGGGSFGLTGGDVSFVQGNGLVIGSHTIDFQRFGFANRAANLVLSTQSSGSVVILSSGGKSSDITQTWTNSLGTVSKVTSVVDYPDFAGYGTQVGKALGGGAGQTFHIPVTTDDENTSFATEVVVPGTPRVRAVNNNVSNSSGGATVTSASITVDGPAMLIADWWGSSPVVPPFSTPSPGVGTPYTAVPNNGFTVIDSYLVNNEFGEVQAARAVKAVTASGTYNVTWTHSPNQGAQTWLIAVQPPSSITADPGSFALTGGSATFQTTKVGSGTAAGISTASGTGVSAAAGAGTAAGVSTVSGSGASKVASSGTAAGTSAPSGSGASLNPSSGSSTGSSTVSGTGASLNASTGTSAGTSTASGSGSSLVASSGSSSGTSTASGVGASLAASNGVANGVATASGSISGAFPATGTASGVAAATGSGASLVASSGSAVGVSSASGTGGSLFQASGTSDGVSGSTGTGASLAASVGIANGTSTALGSGPGISPASGTSTGVGTAFGIGASLAASSGTADGTASATGTGASSIQSTGSSTGSGLASGIGASSNASSGISSGISSSIAVGASLAAASGTAAGIGTAFGTSSSLPGTSTGVSAGTATAFGIGACIAASFGVAAGSGVAFGSGPITTPPKSTPRISVARHVSAKPVLIRKRRT